MENSQRHWFSLAERDKFGLIDGTFLKYRDNVFLVVWSPRVEMVAGRPTASASEGYWMLGAISGPIAELRNPLIEGDDVSVYVSPHDGALTLSFDPVHMSERWMDGGPGGRQLTIRDLEPIDVKFVTGPKPLIPIATSEPGG